MIQDRLSNGALYAALGERFAAAFSWLAKVDPDTVTADSIEIRGSEIYAQVQRYHTKPPSQGLLENHKYHADIQVVVSGRERMDYCFAEGLTMVHPYSAERDLTTYEHVGCTQCIVSEGEFTIFLPDDAHATQLAVDGPEEIFKLVVKVKL